MVLTYDEATELCLEAYDKVQAAFRTHGHSAIHKRALRDYGEACKRRRKLYPDALPMDEVRLERA